MSSSLEMTLLIIALVATSIAVLMTGNTVEGAGIVGSLVTWFCIALLIGFKLWG